MSFLACLPEVLHVPLLDRTAVLDGSASHRFPGVATTDGAHA